MLEIPLQVVPVKRYEFNTVLHVVVTPAGAINRQIRIEGQASSTVHSQKYFLPLSQNDVNTFYLHPVADTKDNALFYFAFYFSNYTNR